MQHTDVSQLQRLAAYREQRPNIFPSVASLDWFMRNNRQQLVDAGALLMLTGRLMVDPPKFDAVVGEVGRQKAAA